MQTGSFDDEWKTGTWMELCTDAGVTSDDMEVGEWRTYHGHGANSSSLDETPTHQIPDRPRAFGIMLAHYHAQTWSGTELARALRSASRPYAATSIS